MWTGGHPLCVCCCYFFLLFLPLLLFFVRLFYDDDNELALLVETLVYPTRAHFLFDALLACLHSFSSPSVSRSLTHSYNFPFLSLSLTHPLFLNCQTSVLLLLLPHRRHSKYLSSAPHRSVPPSLPPSLPRPSIAITLLLLSKRSSYILPPSLPPSLLPPLMAPVVPPP